MALEKFAGAESQATTTSIDEAVEKQNLEKVDFIKMDVEGAELPVLKGAAKTLKRFKPKLALSAYHRPDDFRRIPEFIKSVSPGYRLYLGHYSIHAEETVLYAVHE